MPGGLCSISWEILEDVERIASGIPWMCNSTSLRIPGRGRVLENIKGILMIKEEHPLQPASQYRRCSKACPYDAFAVMPRRVRHFLKNTKSSSRNTFRNAEGDSTAWEHLANTRGRHTPRMPKGISKHSITQRITRALSSIFFYMPKDTLFRHPLRNTEGADKTFPSECQRHSVPRAAQHVA